MIKGFYAAVSGMIVNAMRQNVLAHNIANMQTPGFKQVLTTVEDFTHTEVDYSPGNLLRDPAPAPVGMLGLGAQYGPEFVDFAQGGLMMTGNLYDLAIQGDGFFRVQTPDGLRYTRDGRFLRDAQNNLVTIEGYPVLSMGNQPIRLPEGDFNVRPDGTITVNGAVVAQLGLSRFQNPAAELSRAGGNLFAGPAQSTAQGTVQVTQGALEMSNANPTRLMTEMVEVARSYEAAQKMVQNQDELLGKAIASLGRIG
ncbi:MAG TPA: flagellar basal-body rod protein FlgF [Anaerolinea thermolimosa]|uniref:Flagellar basal-body rod protein FlgF n=1 Tax=Anaerolinea thermolimosa TaxID=229919 RepID=A0A3D1JCH1_9CHLR|nr:flagellar basal-body rod protein FlgF [Anaerolinea thermolimosa]GAP07903.1 flagellar basal-body rod protein FlgF [Anaerolinea thermolimosa]HCE16280.1 flagellar basal-body rod protein FlgF [Anaerolinea thermolimosa]